jgi:hypothetical protein
MSKAIRAQGEEVRTLAFGAISGVYAGIGTELTRPVRLIVLQNLTNALVMVSLDGLVDWMPLATNAHIILDVTSNKTIDTGFFFGEGQRFYIKDMGAAATVNGVYVSTLYGTE